MKPAARAYREPVKLSMDPANPQNNGEALYRAEHEQAFSLDAEPRPDHSLTLVCERSGLLFRVRYTDSDGNETVSPWREYSSALVADANEQWRRWWKEGLLSHMGTYRP